MMLDGDQRFAGLGQLVQSRLSSLFASGLCSPGAIDDRVLGALAELPQPRAVDALDKFEAGLAKSDVRNHSAYLSSVIKRLQQGGGAAAGPTGLEELAPQAQEVLQQLFEAGQLRRGDLDAKCLRILASHPPEFQVLALDTFAERNLMGVRNMAAFFTTHLIRTEEQVRSGQLQLPVFSTGQPLLQQQLLQQQQLLLQQQLLQQQQQQLLLGATALVPPPPLAVPPPASTSAGAVAAVGGPAFPPLDGARPPPAAPRGPGGAAVGPGPGPGPTGPPAKHYGVEQAEWGVRIDEFHGLSPLAKFVHPAAALKLQELWDTGNKLVSLLDDSSWEALAGLDATHAVQAVGETAKAMALVADDISAVNAVFVKAATKFPKRPTAPSAASVLGGPGRPGLGPERGPAGMPPPPGGGGGGGLGPVPPQVQFQQQQQQQQHLQQAQGVAGGVLDLGLQQQSGGGLGLPGGGGPGLAQGLAAVSGMMVLPPQPPPLGPQQPGGPVGGGMQMQMPLGLPGAMLGGFPQAALLGPATAQMGLGLGLGGGMQLPGPAGSLPASLQQSICGIVASSGGMVRPDHFDAKVVGMMQRLGELESLRVLDEFAQNDASGIRNVSAFIMGILRRHAGEAAAAAAGGDRGEYDGGQQQQYGGGGGHVGRGRGGGRRGPGGGRHGAGGRGGEAGGAQNAYGTRFTPY